MKILNARIRWNLEWANDPDLEVLVDRFPSQDEFEFEQKGRCWFAEKDGAVSFFSHSGEDVNEKGFYSSTFKLRMKDGSIKTLRGPWSSRSGVMNKQGFTPSVEVRIFEDEESFNRGYTAFAGHITLKLAQKVIKKFLPNVYLVRIEDETDIYYVPSMSPIKVQKPTKEEAK